MTKTLNVVCKILGRNMLTYHESLPSHQEKKREFLISLQSRFDLSPMWDVADASSGSFTNLFAFLRLVICIQTEGIWWMISLYGVIDQWRHESFAEFRGIPKFLHYERNVDCGRSCTWGFQFLFHQAHYFFQILRFPSYGRVSKCVARTAFGGLMFSASCSVWNLGQGEQLWARIMWSHRFQWCGKPLPGVLLSQPSKVQRNRFSPCPCIVWASRPWRRKHAVEEKPIEDSLHENFDLDLFSSLLLTGMTAGCVSWCWTSSPCRTLSVNMCPPACPLFVRLRKTRLWE